tara:strand:+ start:517 stop:714 length:198 start_codon:yes stop_codon:yes gene_type:complete
MKFFLIYIYSFILIQQRGYDSRKNQSIYDDGLLFELLGWKGALIILILVLMLMFLLGDPSNDNKK